MAPSAAGLFHAPTHAPSWMPARHAGVSLPAKRAMMKGIAYGARMPSTHIFAGSARPTLAPAYSRGIGQLPPLSAEA
jgi:hypothetical protein